MNRLIDPFRQLATVLVLTWAVSTSADQYAWNSRAVCLKAVGILSEGSLVVSYCSLCENEYLEVWRVKNAFVTATEAEGYYQVVVWAKRLFRSTTPLNSTRSAGSADYERLPDGEDSLIVTGVDLAYLYVRRTNGRFLVLAKELKLKPLECRVKKIRLPDNITAEPTNSFFEEPPTPRNTEQLAQRCMSVAPMVSDSRTVLARTPLRFTP